VNGTGRDRRNYRRIGHKESLGSVQLEIRVHDAVRRPAHAAGADRMMMGHHGMFEKRTKIRVAAAVNARINLLGPPLRERGLMAHRAGEFERPPYQASVMIC